MDREVEGQEGQGASDKWDRAVVNGDACAESARQTAERMGFIYWPGGDEAPADWDGGPYLCRDGGVYHMRGYDWQHGTGCWNRTADWDRIGYKAPTRSEGCALTHPLWR